MLSCLVELKKYIKINNVFVIYFEVLVFIKVVKILVDEIGVELVVLNFLESLI